MSTPNIYIIGQIVVLEDLITDPNDITEAFPDGVPIDDATDVVTVYAPDDSWSTPAVVHAALGTYTAQVTPDQAGYWTYVWRSTSTGAGAGTRRFYVRAVP